MNTSLAAAIALSAIGAFAAQNAADHPKFEAASVKRAEQCALNSNMGPGTVVLQGFPLKPILVEAFRLPKDQIVGPAWLDEDCFEIFGKIPEGVGKDQIPAMLQALLAERFKLVTHKDDRPRQVYALVVDKGGPKFKESAPITNAVARTAVTRFLAGSGTSGVKGSMTMAALAHFLSGKGYGPVQDFTELTGKYDIDLAWAPDRNFEPMGSFASNNAVLHPDAQVPPPPAADLFAALRESLGLKLEPRKEPVEMLVIDHIERIPTEN